MKTYAKSPGYGGICRDCRHNLAVRADGTAYCTNTHCRNHKTNYRLGKNPNG